MHFGLSERENFLVENARAIAQHVAHQSAYVKNTGYLRKIWDKYGDTGIFGMPVPAEYKGSELSALQTALSLYGFALGTSDSGLAFSLAAHTLAGAIPLVKNGSSELQNRILPLVASGKFILANAMTEPASGSDAFALATKAVKNGKGYLLSGTKTFCTNATVADGILVYALTDPEKKFFGGISCFLLEKGKQDFKTGPEIEKAGLSSSPVAEVFLENIFVPSENLVGKEGSGAMVFLESMNWERAGMSAMHAGTMRRLCEVTKEYILQKESGGKKLSDHQGAQFRLAEMFLQAEISFLLAMRAAAELDRGNDATSLVAQAKIFSSEALHNVAREAIILHGGNGITRAYGIAQALSDAQAAAIYSGPNDVLRELVASRL